MGLVSHLAVRRSFYMPHETGPQVGTMMSWPTECSVVHETGAYPPGDIHATRTEVAAIGRAIAKYQPLRRFVPDPAVGETRPDAIDTNLETAKAMLGGVNGVTIHPTQNAYSLWARDTSPTFVRSKVGVIINDWEDGDDPGDGCKGRSTKGETLAMLLNYNQWG